jgi:hypothetical protein
VRSVPAALLRLRAAVVERFVASAGRSVPAAFVRFGAAVLVWSAMIILF